MAKASDEYVIKVDTTEARKALQALRDEIDEVATAFHKLGETATACAADVHKALVAAEIEADAAATIRDELADTKKAKG